MPTNDPELDGRRLRLARQIHDGPQQILASIGIRLQMLEDDVPGELRPTVAEVAAQVAVVREQLRALSLEADGQD